MAGSVNKVILIGNVGADPEIRSLNSGDRVANIRLATSETWKDRSTGEKKERTEWHRVVVFNDGLVGVIENYVRKGSKLYVEGQIQTRKWQDQSGEDRYSTEIVLQKFGGSITLLGGKNDGERDDRGGGGSGGYDGGGFSSGPRTQGSGPREEFYADLDDEIPFVTCWSVR